MKKVWIILLSIFMLTHCSLNKDQALTPLDRMTRDESELFYNIDKDAVTLKKHGEDYLLESVSPMGLYFRYAEISSDHKTCPFYPTIEKGNIHYNRGIFEMKKGSILRLKLEPCSLEKGRLRIVTVFHDVILFDYVKQ